MKLRSLIAIVVAVSIPTLAYAEYYKVNVKRVDKDLYKTTTGGLYIQTRYCYEYTYGDDAVLKYEDYSYDNKLIFSSGTSCDVVKVFK
ncbi:hypothetical protein [Tibeticola sp.]|uniref:hypothetical protein n=1 Tax=Tibeticola sp. TaxID=2005368 RepID=UPI0025E1F60A|nr:hypothetical protein [Tibeticola sp.]